MKSCTFSLLLFAFNMYKIGLLATTTLAYYNVEIKKNYNINYSILLNLYL